MIARPTWRSRSFSRRSNCCVDLGVGSLREKKILPLRRVAKRAVVSDSSIPRGKWRAEIPVIANQLYLVSWRPFQMGCLAAYQNRLSGHGRQFSLTPISVLAAQRAATTLTAPFHPPRKGMFEDKCPMFALRSAKVALLSQSERRHRLIERFSTRLAEPSEQDVSSRIPRERRQSEHKFTHSGLSDMLSTL